MSIVGIGMDVTEVARLETALRRTPALAERLFTRGELSRPGGGRPAPRALAERFAAKEALARAFGGDGAGLRWTDVEVRPGADGRPSLTLTGAAAEHAERLRVRSWHLSLGHRAGLATALVVAEG